MSGVEHVARLTESVGNVGLSGTSLMSSGTTKVARDDAVAVASCVGESEGAGDSRRRSQSNAINSMLYDMRRMR